MLSLLACLTTMTLNPLASPYRPTLDQTPHLPGSLLKSIKAIQIIRDPLLSFYRLRSRTPLSKPSSLNIFSAEQHDTRTANHLDRSFGVRRMLQCLRIPSNTRALTHHHSSTSPSSSSSCPSSHPRSRKRLYPLYVYKPIHKPTSGLRIPPFDTNVQLPN